jgi:hypothetical protein
MKKKDPNPVLNNVRKWREHFTSTVPTKGTGFYRAMIVPEYDSMCFQQDAWLLPIAASQDLKSSPQIVYYFLLVAGGYWQRLAWICLPFVTPLDKDNGSRDERRPLPQLQSPEAMEFKDRTELECTHHVNLFPSQHFSRAVRGTPFRIWHRSRRTIS